MKARELTAYAALSLPLAAVSLPVYVHAPRLYSELGVSLATLGALLLVLRALDALTDPWLGTVADRMPARHGGLRLQIALAMPLIALGALMLFHPHGQGAALIVWFGASLFLLHLGLSAGSIAYFAWGSAMTRSIEERTRVTAARGAAGLVGVLLAAAVPAALSSAQGASASLAAFSVALAVVLLLAATLTLALAPSPPVRVAQSGGGSLGALRQAWRNTVFRRIALIFLINGVAAAVPATLILFFVDDVLQAPGAAGVYLAIYFLCGAAGMPFWVLAARRVGKKRAWLTGMLLSVAAFVWALGMGADTQVAFGVICALSGLAFGADLALPASLLADIIDLDEDGGGMRRDGAYFGVWHLLEKLALALAAGIALPLAGALGYTPGVAANTAGLTIVYALVPCGIKLLAAWLLWRMPVVRPGMRSFQFAGEPA